MSELSMWMSPALDVALITLLAIALWRLGQDPTRIWREREEALREIFGGLQQLVAHAEGQARDLDTRLQGHAERLRAILSEARAAPSVVATATPECAPTRAAAPTDERAPQRPAAAARPNRDTTEIIEGGERDVARQVHELAALATPVEEIARRLGLPAAEVRLLIGLHAAKAAVRSKSGEASGTASSDSAAPKVAPAAEPGGTTRRASGVDLSAARAASSVERPRIVQAL